MATAGFTLAILGLFLGGCLSPISIVMCFAALANEPRGLAVAGLVISAVSLIPAAVILMVLLAALTAPAM